MSMIKSSSIQFHDQTIPVPFSFPDFSSENSPKFGIVKINMTKQLFAIPDKKHQHFVFSIDESGSMYDLCKDNRTKMSHILFTLENMIRIFAEEYNNQISIHVNAFSDKTHTVIDNTIVSSSNVEDLIQKIKKIRPKDSTNIENALEYARINIKEYKKTNPSADVTHLFLTDGRPTMGNEDPMYLKELVSSDYPNIFIGYGTDHDPYLMTELAHYNNGSYFFIEALEKASLVYGEIIHKLLYKLIEDATMELKNGEIYNYKTNTWEKELYIGDLVSEMEKIYQIRSVIPNQVECIIHNPESFQYIIKSSSNLTNLTNYIFRQKTQELLYQVKNYSLNINKNKYNKKYNNNLFHFIKDKRRLQNPSEEPEPVENPLKKELYAFFEIMTNYIEENNLKEDKFLKMLCDDIFVSYTLFGKRHSALVSCARQTSQGAQTTYNVGILEDYDDDSEEFNKHIHINKAHGNKFWSYNTSDSFDSPYSTQGIIDTMTQFCCGTNIKIDD